MVAAIAGAAIIIVLASLCVCMLICVASLMFKRRMLKKERRSVDATKIVDGSDEEWNSPNVDAEAASSTSYSEEGDAIANGHT